MKDITLDEKKRFMGGYLRREDQTKTPGAGDDAARLALREDREEEHLR